MDNVIKFTATTETHLLNCVKFKNVFNVLIQFVLKYGIICC
jgi:hypothetical protein